MKRINTSYPVTGCWDSRQGGRAENQDSCGFIDTGRGLILVVCDGMGGGPAGALASSTAVQKIVEYVMHAPVEERDAVVVANAIEYAHRTLLNMGREKPALRGMGSTATVLLLNAHSATLGHVGDSRIYQLRRGRCIFRTADHSLVGELVRNGTLTEEQARLSSQSNIITRALGSDMSNLAEVTERPYERGDRFALCTDGIWGMMPEKELVRRMGRTSSLSGAVDSIVIDVEEKGRKEGNVHDNLTIALIETKKDSEIKEKMSRNTLRLLAGLAALLMISVVTNIVLGSRLAADDSDDKMSELKSILEEQEKSIRQLEDSIIRQKHAVADVTIRAAEEKAETAQRQMEAAKRAEREAEEAQRKAEVAAQAVESATDVQQKREEIVSTLEQIVKLKANNKAKREKLREKAISDIKKLAQVDVRNKARYDFICKQLSIPRAKEISEKGAEHYRYLIGEVRKIK